MKRRYFTSKLTLEDRRKILRVLGLGQYRFLLFELSGEIILRALETVGSQTSSLLEPLGISDAKKFVEAYPFPVLSLQYSEGGRQLTQRPVNESLSLWEEILPFPFSLFSKHFYSAEKNPAIYPERTWEDLQALFHVLQLFEEKMAETELSVVWLHSAGEEVAFVTHYVRKRRLHVGTSSVLNDLVTEFRHGTLTPDMLFETFGTQAAFFKVDLTAESSDPILKLTEAFHKATQNPFQAFLSQLTPHLTESSTSI